MNPYGYVFNSLVNQIGAIRFLLKSKGGGQEEASGLKFILKIRFRTGWAFYLSPSSRVSLHHGCLSSTWIVCWVWNAGRAFCFPGTCDLEEPHSHTCEASVFPVIAGHLHAEEWLTSVRLLVLLVLGFKSKACCVLGLGKRPLIISKYQFSHW